jgi:hypothetical protein
MAGLEDFKSSLAECPSEQLFRDNPTTAKRTTEGKVFIAKQGQPVFIDEDMIKCFNDKYK